MTDLTRFEPTLAQLDAHLATRSIRKRLADPRYDPAFGQHICQLLFTLVGQDEARYQRAVDDFIQFSLEFLQLQAELERTGSYRFRTHQEAAAAVYHNPEVMEKRYLHGLLLSQAFWINHFHIFHFFQHHFCVDQTPTGHVLEVPIGTGIFLSEFMLHNPGWQATGYDLSASAVMFSQHLTQRRNQTPIHISLRDVFALQGNQTYERIICGELLEHLDEPEKLLKNVQGLLAPHGKLFLTTAIWAASIDHIYLFKSAAEVRAMLLPYFQIEQELVLPVFPNKNPEDEKTPINYACVVSARS